MNTSERRAIPESRIAELRKLARSTDDAERKVAQRLLRQIAPEIQTREQAEQQQETA
jgi:hypothetical protein